MGWSGSTDYPVPPTGQSGVEQSGDCTTEEAALGFSWAPCARIHRKVRTERADSPV
jgi:hypothetical protein